VFGVDTSGFALIVDLTAELPRLYGMGASYECLANLDGVALANRRLHHLPAVEDKVLVHCAEGHGRSATFVSCLLCEIGFYDTPLRAYETVVASRPGARISSSQMKQLENGR
jgi:protein-tyrosine phosphatase